MGSPSHTRMSPAQHAGISIERLFTNYFGTILSIFSSVRNFKKGYLFKSINVENIISILGQDNEDYRWKDYSKHSPGEESKDFQQLMIRFNRIINPFNGVYAILRENDLSSMDVMIREVEKGWNNANFGGITTNKHVLSILMALPNSKLPLMEGNFSANNIRHLASKIKNNPDNIEVKVWKNRLRKAILDLETELLDLKIVLDQVHRTILHKIDSTRSK